MDIVLLQLLATSLLFWHAARVRAMTGANMNILKRVPSYLAALAAIAVIALDCGYSDQSAFTRQFRQAVGLSPSECRRTFRQKP